MARRRVGLPGASRQAEIISRALALLLEKTLAKKAAVTSRNDGKRRRQAGAGAGKQAKDPAARSRHIPHAVRRKVWLRDEGRCAFRDGRGRRCTSRRRLEFHHVDNWARGAEHDPDRIEIRCQPHNLYQAELDYGEAFIRARRSWEKAREGAASYRHGFRCRLLRGRGGRTLSSSSGGPCG